MSALDNLINDHNLSIRLHDYHGMYLRSEKGNKNGKNSDFERREVLNSNGREFISKSRIQRYV